MNPRFAKGSVSSYDRTPALRGCLSVCVLIVTLAVLSPDAIAASLPTAAYFPLVPGSRYAYQLTGGPWASGTITVSGGATWGSESGLTELAATYTCAPPASCRTLEQDYYRWENDGLHHYGVYVQSASGHTDTSILNAPGELELKALVSPGTANTPGAWPQFLNTDSWGGRVTGSSSAFGALSYNEYFEARDLETVVTPAGTFANALRIYSVVNGYERESWYAAGVGVVKWIDLNGITATLTSYSIPGGASGGGSTNFAMPSGAAQGMWWNPDESGWGVNLAHEDNVIFVAWFTYDAYGNPWWLTATATLQPDGSYQGELDETHGPAFNSVPFDASKITYTKVGAVTLTFSDLDHGLFAYTVNGVTQAKPITREAFASPMPVCTFASATPLAAATNVTDMWWNQSESGWGVNLTQEGNVVFAAWYTYAFDGTPLWLTGAATASAPGQYAGTLVETSGPAFSAQPFDPTKVLRSEVGSFSLSFTDGNHGTFAYTYRGVTQTKAVTRLVFRGPGTTCQ